MQQVQQAHRIGPARHSDADTLARSEHTEARNRLEHPVLHSRSILQRGQRGGRDRINSLQASIDIARLTGADQWIIDTYQNYLDQLKQAYAQNRGMTGPIPACNQSFTGFPPSSDQMPASIVYTKPIMQDNHRGVLVGMRTSGGGGSISTWPAGYFYEALASNTNSLVVRKAPVVTDEYPAAPYVENIGARPETAIMVEQIKNGQN